MRSCIYGCPDQLCSVVSLYAPRHVYARCAPQQWAMPVTLSIFIALPVSLDFWSLPQYFIAAVQAAGYLMGNNHRSNAC